MVNMPHMWPSICVGDNQPQWHLQPYCAGVCRSRDQLWHSWSKSWAICWCLCVCNHAGPTCQGKILSFYYWSHTQDTLPSEGHWVLHEVKEGCPWECVSIHWIHQVTGMWHTTPPHAAVVSEHTNIEGAWRAVEECWLLCLCCIFHQSKPLCIPS